MPKSFGWDQTLKTGKVGMDALIAYLEDQGHLVEDVSDDALWRKRDTDLLVDGLMVEVKTDTHAPVNVFFELSVGDKPGCVFTSRAQVWVVLFPKSGTALWLPLPWLQWWLAQHHQDYPRKRINSHRQYSGSTSHWTVEGIAVPITDLEESGLPLSLIPLDTLREEGA